MKQATPDPASPAVEIVKGGDRPLILLCDHAGHEVPPEAGELGVGPANLRRHIGWDIGAAEVTRLLAPRLGATAIFNHVSRLVIDVNRRPKSHGSIPPISDGCVVPGNQHLSIEAENARIRAWFLPYHRAVARLIGRFRKAGVIPVLIAMHSFTPRMNGFDRPWQIGVLWRGDRRLALPVLEHLHGRGDLVIGDNQPYSGLREFGFSVTFHAQRPRLPHIMFEIRQDEIATAAGAARYAGIVAESLEAPLADPTLHGLFAGDNLPSTGGLRAWRHAGAISPLG